MRRPGPGRASAGEDASASARRAAVGGALPRRWRKMPFVFPIRPPYTPRACPMMVSVAEHRDPSLLGCWPAARSGEPCRAWLRENSADGGRVMSPLEVRNAGLHDFIAPDAPIERIAGGL